MINSLKYQPEVNIIIQSQGNWDLIIGTLFKTTKDIYNGIRNITYNFGSKIRSVDTLIHIGANYFGHRYLYPEYKNMGIKIPFTGDWTKEPVKINVNEKKDLILKILATDASLSYKKIAEIIGCSPDNIRYLIKDMEKQRLIEGYSVVLNCPNIHRIFIKLTNADENIITKFRQYGYNTNETIQIVRTIGKYNIFYDIFCCIYLCISNYFNRDLK